jgi:hypothetical protein
MWSSSGWHTLLCYQCRLGARKRFIAQSYTMALSGVLLIGDYLLSRSTSCSLSFLPCRTMSLSRGTPDTLPMHAESRPKEFHLVFLLDNSPLQSSPPQSPESVDSINDAIGRDTAALCSWYLLTSRQTHDDAPPPKEDCYGFVRPLKEGWLKLGHFHRMKMNPIPSLFIITYSQADERW